MTERTYRTGWFALHPTTSPRLAYAELAVRVGHSAYVEIFWASPDSDDGVYSGITLKYMRSRASVATFMCLDVFDSWTREDTHTVPADVRPRLRELVDGTDTDLNELFSMIAFQDPTMIAAITVADLGGEVPAGPNIPASNHVWRTAPNVPVESIKPWWESTGPDHAADSLAELAKISPEAAAIARRMGNIRPMS